MNRKNLVVVVLVLITMISASVVPSKSVFAQEKGTSITPLLHLPMVRLDEAPPTPLMPIMRHMIVGGTARNNKCRDVVPLNRAMAMQAGMNPDQFCLGYYNGPVTLVRCPDNVNRCWMLLLRSNLTGRPQYVPYITAELESDSSFPVVDQVAESTALAQVKINEDGTVDRFPDDGKIVIGAAGSLSNLKEAASAYDAVVKMLDDNDLHPVQTQDALVSGMLMRLSPITYVPPTAFVGTLETICPGLLIKPAYVLSLTSRLYEREAYFQVAFFEDGSGEYDTLQFGVMTCLKRVDADWTSFSALKEVLVPELQTQLQANYEEALAGYNSFQAKVGVGPIDNPSWKDVTYSVGVVVGVGTVSWTVLSIMDGSGLGGGRWASMWAIP